MQEINLRKKIQQHVVCYVKEHTRSIYTYILCLVASRKRQWKSLPALFYFPSKLWPKVVIMLSEHLIHLAFVNLSALPFWTCLCICKLSGNGEFNMWVTNMVFPLIKLITGVFICCSLFLVQLEGGNGHCSFFCMLCLIRWTLYNVSFPGCRVLVYSI